MKFKCKFIKRTLMLAAVLCLLTVFAAAPVTASETTLPDFTGSNEALASAEWEAFVASYDPDGSLLAQTDPEGDGHTGLDEKYDHYEVYTREMADKLEEIAAKYGLTLYGRFGAGDVHAIAEKLIVNDYEEFSDKAYNTIVDGYAFSSGTFSFDGIFNASMGRLSVDYQFRRSVKGVLDSVIHNNGSLGEHQELLLINDSGIPFAAVLSEHRSLLMAEFDTCFVRINVMGGTDVGITFDDLKDLLNTFDFSVIADVPGLPVPEPMENENAEADGQQQYITVSREGVAEQIPVENVCILNTGATIAIAPEYFTHNVRDDVDFFTCEAWKGEREAYYSVYYIGQSSPSDICEELYAAYCDKYAVRNVLAVKVGPYDATAVQFDGEIASPAYQRHFFIVPAVAGCIVIEAQFDIEMYEGLYQIMLALFDTLSIG